MTMTHVNRLFFHRESNVAIFVVITLMQICKICTFVKKYAAFCTFLAAMSSSIHGHVCPSVGLSGNMLKL